MDREEWFQQFVTDAIRSGVSALEAVQMARSAMQTNDRTMIVRTKDFDICRRLNEQHKQQYKETAPKLPPPAPRYEHLLGPATNTPKAFVF